MSKPAIVPSRFIYGCMGLGGGWNQAPLTDNDVKQAQALIEAALALGINVFDHADIYTFGKAEQAFGRVLQNAPQLRHQMLLQSKCAIRFADEQGPKRYDFSAQWIETSVNESLRRLHTERLDVLLLHRPDPLMELEEVAEVINRLQQQGKIAQIGVSNMHHFQIAYLQSALATPIVANQIEMSLAQRDWLEDGITTGSPANQAMGYASGTLEYCQLHQIRLQAWGSLAQGRFSGASDDKHDQAVAQTVQRLAVQYDCSSEAMVLAWLMRHPANIQPVIGTTNEVRLAKACQAQKVKLSRAHWYELLEAVRGEEVP